MIGVGSLLGGLVFLGVELGCAFAASARVMRRWSAVREPSVSVLCHATLITAFVLVVHVVPGALGVLGRGTVLVASGVALVVTVALTRGTAASSRPAETDRRNRSVTAVLAFDSAGVVAWGIALAVLALVVGYTAGFLRTQFGTVPLGIDALTFHLPNVASWMRTGSLWQIDQFVPGQAHGNYPNNGDVLFLALVLPFKSALLARGVMLPYLALTGIAVYAIARELGASRPSAITFGAAVCAIPSVAWPTLIDTETDTLMLFATATGILLLLRHARTRAGLEFVLAGLALGISFGTKWYAVPGVIVIIVVWALARLIAGGRLGQVARGVAKLIGLVLALGGFWLLRNWVESADPFFPVKVAPLGITLFDAPPNRIQQLGGFTIGDYLLKPHVLRAFIFPALRDALQWLGVLISAAGLLAGGLAAWELRRRRAGAVQGAVVALTVTGALLAVVYVFTPDTALGLLNFPVQTEANVRYLMPALIVAAPLAAWIATRLGRFGVVLLLATAALTVQALARIYPADTGTALLISSGVFLLGAGWWARGLRRSAPRRPGWMRPAIAYLLVMLALVAGCLRARSRFTYQAYATADATLSWILTHAPSGHAIGLSNVWSNDGLSPILPAFGPRLGNRVGYVGPWVRHLLGQYTTGPAYDRSLVRGDYDLLIVGLGFPTPLPHVPDETWAVQAGYREVAQSPRLALFARDPASRARYRAR